MDKVQREREKTARGLYTLKLMTTFCVVLLVLAAVTGCTGFNNLPQREGTEPRVMNVCPQEIPKNTKVEVIIIGVCET